MRPSHPLWREARSLLTRHCPHDGLTLSALPSVHLMRFGWSSLPLVSTQFPCMAMVIQGTKSVEFGQRQLEYHAGQYLLTSIDVPATSRIVNASRTHPLLAVGVQIDFTELRELLQRCDHLPQSTPQPGIAVFDAGAPLWDSLVRLLRLLDTPQHARPLAPLYRQELLYHLLSGPAGSRLLEICRHGSPSNRIADAAARIQHHYADSIPVTALARSAGMSPASFHQHFKAATGLTPIQYQRRIRLQEARRRLLTESIQIGEASFQVGYESPSQFSKDYRVYFGRLPKDDLAAYRRNEFTIHAYSPDSTTGKHPTPP